MSRIGGAAAGDLLGDGGAGALGPCAAVLRGFAADEAPALVAEIARIAALAPFRRMTTPRGHVMSVAMTNCGRAGWITDRRGYRYAGTDPMSGAPWPEMPAPFRTLAEAAATAGDFAGFAPDSCLINRYVAGTRLTLHQDRNERDFAQPIVSVSLGLQAVFLWGGLARGDRRLRLVLESGDVVVWGGPARLAFHGIDPLAAGVHPLTGNCRYNLTFRKAL
ncbi:MAG TPA: DNA oxidative demethylase AlkB [Stellaceae bacterium]|nr:DNA oxidative demethylase AlkB [Stellaceae bacterium]